MPESKPYRFHPEAWQEFEAADDWYRERSFESSIRFLSAVYDGLEQISQWPQRWPRHFQIKSPGSHPGLVTLPVGTPACETKLL